MVGGPPDPYIPNQLFFDACKSCQFEAVKSMIDQNPAVVDSCNDNQTDTALQFVARRGQLRMLQLFLDRGAYPCHRLGSKGLTALEFVSQELVMDDVADLIAKYYGNVSIRLHAIKPFPVPLLDCYLLKLTLTKPETSSCAVQRRANTCRNMATIPTC